MIIENKLKRKVLVILRKEKFWKWEDIAKVIGWGIDRIQDEYKREVK